MLGNHASMCIATQVQPLQQSDSSCWSLLLSSLMGGHEQAKPLGAPEPYTGQHLLLCSWGLLGRYKHFSKAALASTQ